MSSYREERVSLTSVLWVMGLLIGVIGTLATLLYNINSKRIDGVEIEIKVLTSSQTKLLSATEALYSKTQDMSRTVDAIGATVAERTLPIRMVEGINNTVNKHTDRLDTADKQILMLNNRVDQIVERLRGSNVRNE